MNVSSIFKHLLEVGKQSKDPEGVVAACLVRNDEILIAKPCSDDSQFHAEYLVLKESKKLGMKIKPDDILYTTLEPCSDFPDINDGRDCVTVILDAGVKNVVYGARDPECSTKAVDRLKIAGVKYSQIDDPTIIKKCADLFNTTIRKNLSGMKLPRQYKL